MRRFATTLCLAALAAGLAARGMAAEAKPAAVVCIASIEKLNAAQVALGKMTGLPLPTIDMQLQMVTGGKGVPGLDRAKPWGMVIAGDAKSNEPMTFAPVADLKGLLEVLPPHIEHKQEADGVVRVEGPNPIFLKGSGGWVFGAGSAEQLADLPADPAAQLGDLPNRYLIAGRFYPQNLSPQQRQQFFNQLDMFALFGGEGAKGAVTQLKNAIDEMQELTFGLSVNEAAGKLDLELTIKAVPDSKLAHVMSRFQNRSSQFAALRSGNAGIAFAARLEGKLNETELAALKSQHDAMLQRGNEAIDSQQSLPDEAKPVFKEALASVLGVWLETTKTGKQDMGVALLTGAKPTLVYGAYVSDPEALVKVAKKLAEQSKEDPALPPIKWNAEAHAGHDLHLMTLPISDPQAVALLGGEKIDVVMAVGQQSVWIAAGANAVADLKELMSAKVPNAAGPAVAGAVRLKKLLMETKNPAQQMLQPLFANMAAGADEVTLKSEPLDGGVAFKVQVGGGVIKTLVILGQTGRPSGPVAPPDGFELPPDDGDF